MIDPTKVETEAKAAASGLWAKYKQQIVIAVLCLAIGFIAAKAFAAGTSATLGWTMPTQYVDTTPLPLSDIGVTTITWTRPGSTMVIGSVNVNAPATSVVVPGLVCGNFSFTATVTTTATAAQPNDTSDSTNAVIYATGVTCKPNPPTGLTAN